MVEKQRSPGDWVQLKINMRERLRQKLERAAADNGHPMIVEITDRLWRSFSKDDTAKLVWETSEKAAEKAAKAATVRAIGAFRAQEVLDELRHRGKLKFEDEIAATEAVEERARELEEVPKLPARAKKPVT
jgi:hypothetical protein